MKVNSTNPEEAGTTRDNDIVLKVPVEVKAQLGVVGRSNPEQVDFSIRNRTEGEHATFDFEAGPVVSHLYQVGLELSTTIIQLILGHQSRFKCD